MSSAANDEDPWIESIDESQQHQSQTGEVILDENNVSVRRSTRLASKSSCSPGISDWPLPKILEILFKSNIPVPSGATHEELFTLLCESIDVPASHSPPHPPTSGKKNTQKRKNFEPASTSATGASKWACGPSSSARSSHSMIQNNDPVLSALSNIQSSISDMNSRIQALESGSASRISRNLLLSGPASSNTASTTVRLPGAEQQVDDVIPATVPRRTMGSAVPVSTGSTFFPPTAAISHQLRSQIIAGDLIEKGIARKFYLSIIIERHIRVEALLDTGADITLMSAELLEEVQEGAKRTNRTLKLQRCELNLQSYSHTGLRLKHVAPIHLTGGSMDLIHPIYVSPLKTYPLLNGKDLLNRYEPLIDFKHLKMWTQVRKPLPCQSLDSNESQCQVTDTAPNSRNDGAVSEPRPEPSSSSKEPGPSPLLTARA
ncbi:hypothetical protein G5714_024531 [Onychostoma macrolepis]|uniref:Peptidase A2 domain-containing protein n=1 Tax=Onychostoma macrolepis TaxID=369639 RepID=A0A7J6BM57_9TELE|nr:hypothetical protein G5714_024531 [Onychostoma macrolepis]